MLELDRLRDALVTAGIDDEIADWATEIEWDEYADIAPDLLGVGCGGDADGDANDSGMEMYVGVVAVDLGETVPPEDFYDLAGFGTLAIEAADVRGGELANACVEDVGDYFSACVSFWDSDGLVLGVVVASSEQAVPDGVASVILADTLDDMLATLAAGAPR